MRYLRRITDNDVVRMVTALLVCGVASAAVLVLVYRHTMPQIILNQEREMNRAIERIFPEIKDLEELDRELFRVSCAEGETLGYAFTASGSGYQGEIKLMIGADPGLEQLIGISVLESQETPGLGAEILSEEFRAQFRGLDVSREVGYVRNRRPEEAHKIEAITGATISSRAVVSIINNSVAEVRGKLGAVE